jgi:hypothetical protein
MKTVELGQTNGDIARLLGEAREEDLVLRLADGSEFLVIALDDFDYEIARARANPSLMALLQERAKQGGSVSLDDLKKRLQI